MFFETGLVTTSDSDVNIYESNICLSYVPPEPLPVPFPKTLQIEGMYLVVSLSSALSIREYLALRITALSRDSHLRPAYPCSSLHGSGPIT